MCSTRYSQMSLDSDEDVIEVKDKRTVSDDQLYQLYKFLERNRDVASETKKRLKLKWESITPILNFQDGARKNWQGWCEYWRNYRSKILIKIESESRLSDYEKKFYELFKEEPQAEVARKSHQPVVEVSTSTSRRQTVLENNDGVVTAKLCDEDKKLLLEVERLCKKIDARMAEMSSLLRRRP